jgi:hypothetical protein
MDEKHHDLVLAVTSHLPHLIAYTIVGSAADLENVTESEVMKYSAGGFRDFTRIAAVRPDHVARHLRGQQGRGAGDAGPLHRGPAGLSRAIRWGEADKLFEHFTRTAGHPPRHHRRPARRAPSRTSARDGRSSSLETLARDVGAASTMHDKRQQQVMIRAADTIEYKTYIAVLERLRGSGWYKVGIVNDTIPN